MKIFCLLVLSMLSMPVLSQELPFRAQRLITDYRGVTTNGTAVVCYGDYGIITTSQDFGQTWSQVSIGDKYSIKKIVAFGKYFIGVTEHSLIKSTDNGRTWHKAPEPFDTPAMIDITNVGNTLYVLTNNAVWTADTNLNLSFQPFVGLDGNPTYTEIAADGENIYIATDARYILHYSIPDQTRTKIDIISAVDRLCSNCSNISDVQVRGGTVYLFIDKKTPGLGYITQIFVRSDDNGKTWKRATKGIVSGGSAYRIVKDEIYFISPAMSNYINGRKFFATEYLRDDSSHFAEDSSYFTIINNRDSIERNILLTGQAYRYTGIAAVNEDTLIAVGANKLITVSYNGGKSWKMRSFFSQYIPRRQSDRISFLSKNKVYALNATSFYSTNDGGVTWLPQRYMPDYPLVVNNSPHSYFFGNNGKGYVRILSRNNTDTNVLVTSDSGETYRRYDNDSLFLWSEKIGDSRFLLNNKEGLDVGGTILFYGSPWEISRINKQNKVIAEYTLILRYTDELRFLDSTRIDADNVLSMVVADNGDVYCLALKTTGIAVADSAGNTVDYTYRYFFLKSTDKGKTWDSVAINLPFKQKFSSFNFLGQISYYYINAIVGHAVCLRGDEILIPSAEGILFRYNFKKNTIDSLAIPALRDNGKRSLFALDKKEFYISESNTVYYAKTGTAELDSVAAQDIFNGWNNLFPSDPNELGKNAILWAHTFDDTTGFMQIGRLVQGADGMEFQINIVKLSINKGITDVAEPKSEEENGGMYLWNSAPYPLPGNNIIASRIYWNSHYDIADAKISVHDINGTPLPEQNITIDRMQNYRGLLQWDCKDAATGLYIIKISLIGKTLVIPVLVAK